MSLRIRYSCPYCNRRIVHHAALAGQLVICSACKGEFYEPTDPLPGKPAERALLPEPQATRRLRVPEGNNPRHDLAVLARRDGSDHRSITEIVEAVLLDEDPPLPLPTAEASDNSAADSNPSDTLHDFGYALQDAEQGAPKPLIPAWNAPVRQSGKLSAAPTSVLPGAPTSARSRPQYAPPVASAAPSLAGPKVRPLVPSEAPAVVAPAKGSRSIPKPAVPGAVPVSSKSSSNTASLAGVSIKQMVEELRRRGLGVALVTCDMAPIRNHELAWSDNMTREDALAVMRKYLDSLRQPHQSSSHASLLKRVWRQGDEEPSKK